MRDHAGGTRRVLRERIGYPGFLRKIVSTIREHARVRLRTPKSQQERLERLRGNYVLCAFRDCWIGIGRKNSEQLGAVLGCERSSGKNGQLLFRCGPPGTYTLAKVGANGALQTPAQAE